MESHIHGHHDWPLLQLGREDMTLVFHSFMSILPITGDGVTEGVFRLESVSREGLSVA
jgi:hypothetical protein